MRLVVLEAGGILAVRHHFLLRVMYSSARCFANVSAFSLLLCLQLFCVGEFIRRGDLVIQVFRDVLIGFHIEL